jgi:hypothetical protein
MPGLFGTSGANHARAVSSQTTFVADTEAGAGPSDPKDTAVDRELDPAAKRARLAELKQIAKEKKEAGGFSVSNGWVICVGWQKGPVAQADSIQTGLAWRSRPAAVLEAAGRAGGQNERQRLRRTGRRRVGWA